MTQTGQNSAVRTREQQAVELATYFYRNDTGAADCLKNAARHIAEAEARGAEEQRRKDARAVQDVIAERNRQKSVEGWNEAHDDQYASEELAAAAACYAESAYSLSDAMRGDDLQVSPPRLWPWSDDWWKPTTQRRDLVKAGALIIAEIERLDRATLTREEESRQTAAMEARAEAEIEKWSR